MSRILCVLCFLIASAHSATVTLVAGGGTGGDRSTADKIELKEPFALDFDKGANLYFAEMGGNRVRVMIGPDHIVTSVAGAAGEKGYAGDSAIALTAKLNGPHHLAIGPGDGLFVADTFNNCIRKIDLTTGIISAFAGTGEKGFTGDGGPAVSAKFGGVYCISFDSKREQLFLADLDNRRIREINLKTGIVTTVAGNGQKGVPKNDAVAKESPLFDPRAVACDSKNNVYILERSGHALRVVDANGKIRTVAGTGKPGFSGDGGDALKATLNGPKHLCVDSADNVLICDTENHVIRKYSPKDGTISIVAGTGTKGSAGVGGPPEKVQLFRPHGVYAATNGDIYICDSDNHRILKISK